MTHSILVTGAAGFIGFHVAKALLGRGHTVVGLDNLNDYYDVDLKKARLSQIKDQDGFTFVKGDVASKEDMESLWETHGPFKTVIHMAAQAGVRYSLENPYAYLTSNCLGHLTVLEMCRQTDGFAHLVYASSSSVYGANEKKPFSVQDAVNDPLSLYAATKRSDELMSQAYASLYDLPQTGLRFFTVYGPWGRPDMAPYIFTKAILEGGTVRLFNQGQMKRDFTYIDDIVDGVLGCIDKPPCSDGAALPHRLLNLGNTRSEDLMKFLNLIEDAAGKKAKIEYDGMQSGDVKETYADITETTALTGYKPKTTIEDGIPKFVAWFKEYHGL